MTVANSFAAAVLAASVVALPVAGCSAARCQAPAGGRCAGPAALPARAVVSAGVRHLIWGVAESPDGRTLTAVVPCGGRLQVKDASTVTLTWIASSVGAGGMSCARVPLTARLSRPLGERPLVDGASGARLQLLHCAGSGADVFRSSCA